MRRLGIMRGLSIASRARGLLLALAPALFLPVHAMAADRAAIDWPVPRALVAELRDEMDFAGEDIEPDLASVDDTRGLPLIYLFVGLVALPDLVRGIQAAVRDVTCGGVLVEESDDGLDIRCVPALGVGTVVVRQRDGVTVERFEQVDSQAPLLEAITKLSP